MPRRRRCSAFVAALFWLLALPAGAHDYWLQPATFTPMAGEPFALQLWLGSGLRSEEQKAHRDDRTLRFEAVSSDGRRVPIVTKDGALPAAMPALPTPGAWTLLLDRNAATLQHTPKAFRKYLREEGLAAALAEVTTGGDSQRPVRERYSRTLKAFVDVRAADGGMPSPAPPATTGQTLELLPLSHPASSARLRVRVLFEGRPLAGIAVSAHRRGAKRQRATTDAAGDVSFDTTHKGLWLLRTVHLRRAVAGDAQVGTGAGTGAGVDWESFWTAATFERR